MGGLLLVDGHNLLFRMFYGMPFPFYNQSNKNITATVGFIGTVVKMIKYLNVANCLVVFDGENSRDIREVNYKSYKANRETNFGMLPDNENPFVQLEYIKASLDYLRIKWIETDCCECDDYIAMIAQQFDGKVFISSTDTDFFQLVNDWVKIIKFKGKNSVLIDKQYIYRCYGINPEDFVLYKALVGDSSDNIRGIDNVGPKTAKKIINSILDSDNNRFFAIYNKNIDLITRNLQLIKLPNKEMDHTCIDLKDLSVNFELIKNFKPLKIISEITKEL